MFTHNTAQADQSGASGKADLGGLAIMKKTDDADSFDFVSGVDVADERFIDDLSPPSEDYYKYELKNVMVTSYSTSGSAADDDHHGGWIDILSVDQGMF